MAKKGVLFVDDETNILDGLRRMLRSMRKDFELCFSDSGNDALKIMEEKEFDIVLSDMRMPGMDGAQFLTEVQKRYPHTIRIMLTGQADNESVMRTIGVVHQFLAKPCDPDKLKEILLRASALHQLMEDGDLKNLISSIDTLPSLPAMYLELQNKLNDPDVVVSDIEGIIAGDIAMTAKILQLVNSAFFGLFQKVESPARAVTLLGLDTIKALVLGLKIFSEIEVSDKSISPGALWNHSMIVSELAKKITLEETNDEDIAYDSYVAGILHDVGKLILLSKKGSEYQKVIDRVNEEELSLYEAERESFKSTHSDMGAYLIGLWGFKGDIIEAIAFHHQMEKYPASGFTPALAVHVANVMYYTKFGDEVIGKMHTLNEKYIEDIGLGHKVASWKNLCIEYLELQNDD